MSTHGKTSINARLKQTLLANFPYGQYHKEGLLSSFQVPAVNYVMIYHLCEENAFEQERWIFSKVMPALDQEALSG
ncbi:hypothetical protein ACFV1N_45955 [Streptosporangium canum]|uniref:hypothetical protein n=1 Tax=Streptosporangium canum TaxID=324952 RepID=UPI003695539A